ncbi:MAG TPA: cytochrome P450 [Acidimicrobiales bacterium]|nr:cytochrome P450 [Acidimicrobiales bacterium]
MSASSEQAADFDPREFLDPANSANPQPFWGRLRSIGPVVPGLFGNVQVVGRREVEFALQNPQVFSSAMDAVDLGQKRPLIPLQVDPPDHVKYRRLLDPIFAPREMARIEGDVKELVNNLIDDFIERGECEFGAEFAIPLPSAVFLKMMGMPISDLEMFLQMKDGIIRPQGADLEEIRDNQRGWAGRIDDYFASALQEREKERRDDLMSRFLDAEVAGEKLSEDEILGMCFLLLLAGLDTVTDTLECDFAYLAQHDDARAAIVENPDLIPSAVEELLRWETPVTALGRVAAVDTELAGCPIPKGTKVGIALGAANTDDSVIPGAGEVDLSRNPNRHLAFGGGVHRCLGSHLARMELRVALREWHRRIPEYHIAPETQLVYTPGLRQIERLPLVFTAAPV